MTHYKISKDMRARLKELVRAMEAKGIKGGIYFYKRGECSCCFGLRDGSRFEINGNIPGNWGVYGRPESAYHKISYSLDLKEAQALAKEARRIMRGSGWRVVWEGTTHSAIMIEQKPCTE